jgi:hypothetical protein
MGRMRPLASPVVLLRAGEGLVVGHVALGNAVAGAVQQRGTDGERSWTATVLGAGQPVHGGNDAGVVCAALDRGGHPLVRQVLERADSVAAALALLGPAGPARDPLPPVTLLIADAVSAVVAGAGDGGELEVEPVVPEPGEGSVAAAIAALREREPAPQEGCTPAAGLVAVLDPRRPAALHLALGPPSCAVLVRHWPGLELTADESASPEGAPLARLAAAVAATTGGDQELRAAARARLDRVEAGALAEGEAAERMATLMDAGTDDRGAAVRRLVAQSYAVELAMVVLHELAVPAGRGSKPSPSL